VSIFPFYYLRVHKKRIDLEKSPFMNYQGTGATVDRWITANVSSCIDFGIDKLIKRGSYYYNCSNWDYWFSNAFSLNKIAGYTKRKYATINGFKQQEN
jgi:hypothetical protein